MRCLRIFGAYSFRFSRRHSTIMMITFLIVVLTVIFQLYAFRHLHTAPRVGDFNYRPGAFLKDQQPNENISYCQFNYGLPDKLKWDTLQVHTPPETGENSSYRVIYDAIRGTAYANVSKYDTVTYVTQATPEFLYHIIEIAKSWEGPISVAVYVPDYDLDITMQILNHLCHCYSGMSKVSLHLFYPKRALPKMSREPLAIPTQPPTSSNLTKDELMRRKIENYKMLNKMNRAQYIESVRKSKIQRMMLRMPTKRTEAPRLTFKDCSCPENFEIPTYRREFNMIYPINVGRNAARKSSRTNYFLVSDIELLPSDRLASKFVTMLRQLMGDKKRDEGCVFAKTVFVVPLFEVERGEDIPRDKDTLIRMVATNRALYFHQRSCSHCQRFPGIQTWLKKPSTDILQPLLITRREYPYHRWEPLYFGTHREPWYSEMLSWEGQQDKMTQMLEICLQQYRFVIANDGYLVHSPQDFRIMLKEYNPDLYRRAAVANTYRYELCLQEYRMVVLDGAFLCHAATKPKFRHKRAERINNQRYLKIITSLKHNYSERPACKVDFGCR